MSRHVSDQEIDHSDKNAVPSECHRCHQRFPATDLKEASIPSFVGLMSATDVELDDHEPPPVLIDQRLYCRACRSRLNTGRILLALVLTSLLITSTSIAALLFGW